MRSGAVSRSGQWVAVHQGKRLTLYHREGRARSAVSLDSVVDMDLNDRWVAVLSGARRLSVWQVPHLSLVPLWGQTVAEPSAVVSVGSERVAVGFSSGALAVYNSQGHREKWSGVTEPITGLGWDTSSSVLWVGTARGWLWRIRGEKSERWVQLSVGEVLAVRPGEPFVYVGTSDGGVHQVETRARSVAYRWYGVPVEICALALCPEGVISADRTGMLWRWRSGKEIPTDEFATPLGTVWGLSDLDTAQSCLAVGSTGIARLLWQGKHTQWIQKFESTGQNASPKQSERKEVKQ